MHRVRGLPRRVSGHDDDVSQFFVEDGIGHSFLSTKTENVVDLNQHPTYVILDLGSQNPWALYMQLTSL